MLSLCVYENEDCYFCSKKCIILIFSAIIATFHEICMNIVKRTIYYSRLGYQWTYPNLHNALDQTMHFQEIWNMNSKTNLYKFLINNFFWNVSTMVFHIIIIHIFSWEKGLWFGSDFKSFCPYPLLFFETLQLLKIVHIFF